MMTTFIDHLGKITANTFMAVRNTK